MTDDSREENMHWELAKKNATVAVDIVNHVAKFVAKELLFAFSPIVQAADTDDYGMNDPRRDSSIKSKRKNNSKTKPRPTPESMVPLDPDDFNKKSIRPKPQPSISLDTDRQASGEPRTLNVEYLEKEYGRSILKEDGVNYHDLSNDSRTTKPETKAKVESIDSGSVRILPAGSEQIFRPRLHEPVDDHPNEFGDLVRMNTVNYANASSRPVPFPEMQKKRGTKPIPILVRPISDRTDTKEVHEKGLSSFERKRKMELQEMKKILERQSSKREQEKRTTEIRQGAMQDHEIPANKQAMGMRGHGNAMGVSVEEKRSESQDMTRALETMSLRQGHEQHSGRRENTHTAELRDTKFISVKEKIRGIQYEQQQLEGSKHRGNYIQSDCEEMKTVEQKLRDKNRQAKELISQMCYEQQQPELLQQSHAPRFPVHQMSEIERYYRIKPISNAVSERCSEVPTERYARNSALL